KIAHQPYHPIYAPNDGSISVANSTYAEKKNLKLVVKVLSLDMAELFSREVTLNLPADGVERLFTLPAAASLPNVSPTYFVDLRLYDDKGVRVGGNFYWESTKADKLDYTKSTWYHTPHTEYADFGALADLPKVALERKVTTRKEGDRAITTVKLSNPSKSLAFFVRLKLNKGKAGDEVLPVLWSDNYVSLLPGETREVNASYRQRDLGGQPPVIELVGSNLRSGDDKLSAASKAAAQ
ncbi:MAG TPA: glycoside hydrolase family 2 protein, partial [Polyangia bacterium]